MTTSESMTPADEGATLREAQGAVGDEAEAGAMLANLTAAMFDREQAPLQLGRYILERKLGQGAFGVVYLGYDPDLGRKVAVKVLRPRADTTAVARQRFFREARVLASVLDPGLAAVFDVGGADGDDRLGSVGAELLYIVMEYVEGGDLSEWLSAEERSVDEVLAMFLRAGRGLAAAHKRDVIHRDFKPSNVLIGDDGSVKVADFGLAQAVGATEGRVAGQVSTESSGWSNTDEATLTKTGMVLGTPMYMAPEQHYGARVDMAADQYAFCVALYRGLTGKYPFLRVPLAELALLKKKRRIEPWPNSSGVPLWVRRVVERGLEPDPDKRFVSMSALLRRLEHSPTRRFIKATRWAVLPVMLAGVGYVAHDKTRPAHVDLVLASSADTELAEVEVFVDGELAQLEGSRIDMSPGRHLLEVTAAQHKAAARTVDADAGGDYRVDLRLVREEGTVDIRAEPSSARILVDGKDHGSRLRDVALPSGLHRFEVQLEGYFTQAFSWDVVAGSRKESFVALRPAGVWEYASPPPSWGTRWLPDVTGDGRDDVFVEHAGQALLLDPWNDEVAASFVVTRSFVPERTLEDLNADGVLELIALVPSESSRSLRAWTLSVEGASAPLWEVTLGGDAEVRGQLAVVLQSGLQAGPQSGPQAGASVVAVHDEGTVRGYAGSDGRVLFEVAVAADANRIRATADHRQLWIEGEHSAAVLRADGTTVWRGAAAGAMQDAGDLSDDGITDVVSLDREAERIYARDGASGAALWSAPAPGIVAVSPLSATATDAPTLVVRSETSFAVHNARDGALRWQAAGAQPRAYGINGQVVITSDDGEGHLVARAGADGAIQHRFYSDSIDAVAVGDFNGDGVDEFSISHKSGELLFLSSTYEPLARATFPNPLGKSVALRDADKDGVTDALFTSTRGISIIAGPKTKWTTKSEYGIRAAPRIVEVGGSPKVLTTYQREGERQLALVDGGDGEILLHPMPLVADLHREPEVAEVDGETLAYYGARGSVFRHRLSDGAMLGSITLGGHIYASPTVADVDEDGEPEVLICRFGNGEPILYVLRADLSLIEREVDVPGFSWSRALVEDVDDDGHPEVFVFSNRGGVTALQPSDDYAVRWTVDIGDRIMFAGVVVRGANGRMLLLVNVLGRPGPDVDTLVVLDAQTGEVVHEHLGLAARGSTPLVLDADDDGAPDVFISDHHGMLRRFVAAAMDEPLWSQQVASGAARASAPLGWGRMRATDGPAVVSAWRDGAVVVTDARTGDNLWSYATGARVEGRPAVADIDGDGEAEVVIGTHDGSLMSLRSGPPTWAELTGAPPRARPHFP